MFSMEEEANLVQDREDLIALLHMRFGEIEPSMIEAIYKSEDYQTLERLILVASNAPRLRVFVEELQAGPGSFRITGERFNPLNTSVDGGEST